MSVNKNNNIFEKTSFLGNNSSEFVENLYTEYLNNPNNLPEQWKDFFKGLKDQKEKILNNANAPSWSRKKRLKVTAREPQKFLEKNGNLQTSVSNQNIIEAANKL